MAAVLTVLLLLAPDGCELRYRFTKDLSYEDATTRSWHMEGKSDGKSLIWDYASEELLRRTVLEVDESRHPSSERVEVVKFVREIRKCPEVEKEGKEVDPCQGKTFLWRRLEDRWGLFEGEMEVTPRYPRLVERMKNWRDARMPREAQKVGATWEITAETWLLTAGQPVPPGVSGKATLKLEAMEENIARISFVFEAKVMVDGAPQKWRQTGELRFDCGLGREIALTIDGTVKVEGAGEGGGTFSLKRALSYR